MTRPRRIVRRVAIALFGVLAIGLPLASPAQAWTKYQGLPPWPEGRASWWSEDSGYDDEMTFVAKVINTSGAKVHFVHATSAESASILVHAPGGRAPCTGYAMNHYQVVDGRARRGQSTIDFGLCEGLGLGTGPTLDAEARRGTIRLLLHEALHTYNLNHESGRCAVMNPAQTWSKDSTFYPKLCTDVSRTAPGLAYCRFMQPDDQSGLIAVYGGRARPLPKQRCPRTNLRPPAHVTTTDTSKAAGHPEITVTWDGTTPGITGMRIIVKKNSCVTATTLSTGAKPIDVTEDPGANSHKVPLLAPGSFCVSLLSYVDGSGLGEGLRILSALKASTVTVAPVKGTVNVTPTNSMRAERNASRAQATFRPQILPFETS